MLSALLGKKIGMTQVYDEQGVIHPVTVVQAGPCSVLQVKSVDTDGYDAVQLGFSEVKAHRASKPQIAHAAKANCKPKKFVREVRLPEPAADVAPGATVTVEAFDGVAFVDVVGTTKGKGYAGVMKRHHFGGQPASHGTERKHRSPGSISGHGTNRGWGGKPKRGKRMAGHMGTVRCTSRNHKLVGIDKENNLLLIKGALPGANGGYLFIRKSKTARVGK
ncbi:MAG TPA: 50S ribosomal protein L3 [Phycisphaerales bacterium]|nr:50S ribosomal protein L3 [Phycisphaerales bacterium]